MRSGKKSSALRSSGDLSADITSPRQCEKQAASQTLASDRQFDDLRGGRTRRDAQIRDANGKFEPSGPGASGVQVKHAEAFFHERFVRMAGHQDLKPGRLGYEVELVQVMEHIDRNA